MHHACRCCRFASLAEHESTPCLCSRGRFLAPKRCRNDSFASLASAAAAGTASGGPLGPASSPLLFSSICMSSSLPPWSRSGTGRAGSSGNDSLCWPLSRFLVNLMPFKASVQDLGACLTARCGAAGLVRFGAARNPSAAERSNQQIDDRLVQYASDVCPEQCESIPELDWPALALPHPVSNTAPTTCTPTRKVQAAARAHTCQIVCLPWADVCLCLNCF
jgi:hypothetical protein